MKRRQFTKVVGVGSALTITGLGASQAYTSADLNRDVGVEVVADNDADAAIFMDVGPAGGSTIDPDGKLVIDGVSESETGENRFLTPDGSFHFGDPLDPQNLHSFVLTNQIDEEREVEIVQASPVDIGDVIIEFFDETGSEEDSLTLSDDSNNDATFNLSPASSVFAVVEIDTQGVIEGETIDGQFSVISEPTTT